MIDIELLPAARWIARTADGVWLRGGPQFDIAAGAGEVLVEFPFERQPDTALDRYDPAVTPSKNRRATPAELASAAGAGRDNAADFARGRDEVVVTIAWVLRRLLGAGHPTKPELQTGIQQWQAVRQALDDLRAGP